MTVLCDLGRSEERKGRGREGVKRNGSFDCGEFGELT